MARLTDIAVCVNHPEWLHVKARPTRHDANVELLSCVHGLDDECNFLFVAASQLLAQVRSPGFAVMIVCSPSVTSGKGILVLASRH